MQASRGASDNAPQRTPSDAARARAGCVLLLPPSVAEAPSDLGVALTNRGLEATPARTCHMAMAELIRRAIASGTLEGSLAGRGEALIIVQPGAQPEAALDDLLASVDKFLPRAAIWAYDASATPRLRRMERRAPEVVVKPDAAREAAAAMRNGLRSTGEPALRLHRDDAPPAPAPAPVGEAQTGDEGESLLSAEELSMLLADDAPEAEERR